MKTGKFWQTQLLVTYPAQFLKLPTPEEIGPTTDFKTFEAKLQVN